MYCPPSNTVLDLDVLYHLSYTTMAEKPTTGSALLIKQF